MADSTPGGGTAHCLCGAVQYRYEGEPITIGLLPMRSLSEAVGFCLLDRRNISQQRSNHNRSAHHLRGSQRRQQPPMASLLSNLRIGDFDHTRPLPRYSLDDGRNPRRQNQNQAPL